MNTLSLNVKSSATDASNATAYVPRLSFSIVKGMVFIFLLVFSSVMAALSISSAAVAVCMIGGINPYHLIPSMPYWCGAVFAFALVALSLSAAVGCKKLTILAHKILKSRSQGHIKLAEESLSLTASYSGAQAAKSARYKKVILVALAVFAVYFVSAFAVSSITAGTMGFWHQWNWFVK